MTLTNWGPTPLGSDEGTAATIVEGAAGPTGATPESVAEPNVFDGIHPSVEDRAAPSQVASRKGVVVSAGVAVAAFALLCALALAYPYKMRQPDPYAYRAQIEALENGEITLGDEEYETLAAELADDPTGWSEDEQQIDSIAQWVQTEDGEWVTEKNPGYGFLAVPFDALGVLRLAPLFFGAIGALGLWFGGRRWLGPWGGAMAVGAFCSSGAMLILANDAYMPTFTGAALLAAAGGLLVGIVYGTEMGRTWRVVIGTGAFLLAGLAVSVRYTDIAVLGVFSVAALAAVLAKSRRLAWWMLIPWGLAAAIPLAAIAAYNYFVFGSVFETGYTEETVSFSSSAITENLSVMPEKLLLGAPVIVLGLIGMFCIRIRNSFGAWAAALLGGWWGINWVVYLFYDWTARQPETQHEIITTRFFMPAMGAVALCATACLVRLPRHAGVAAISALFIFGGAHYVEAVTGGTMFQSSAQQVPSGGNPQGPIQGGQGGDGTRAPEPSGSDGTNAPQRPGAGGADAPQPPDQPTDTN